MKRLLNDVRLLRIFCVLLLIAAAAAVPTGEMIIKAVTGGLQVSAIKEYVIIDPGHGGFDGGATSESGVCEKDINLAIALALRDRLEEIGYDIIMTRDDDISLGKSESSAIRSRKTADLAERKRIIDEKRPMMTVSIHLNSFKEDKSVRGAQVFYPEAGDDKTVLEQSSILAFSIQNSLKVGINDGTDRTPLGKSDVRILKNPLTPIVIVECGFLSNREEAELLQSADYQQKLADCICEGIIQYINFK